MILPICSAGQLGKHDDVVDTIQELGLEVVAKYHQRRRLCLLLVAFGCLDLARAEIRGHYQNSVLEIDHASLRVRQTAIVEDLQQNIEYVRMSFFDLVKKHDRVRPPPHGFGQLAAFLVADVSRRSTDHSGDGVFLHIFRHIEPDHRTFVVEKKLGECTSRFGLTDTCRAQEYERSHGPVRVLQPGTCTADRV